MVFPRILILMIIAFGSAELGWIAGAWGMLLAPLMILVGVCLSRMVEKFSNERKMWLVWFYAIFASTRYRKKYGRNIVCKLRVWGFIRGVFRVDKNCGKGKSVIVPENIEEVYCEPSRRKTAILKQIINDLKKLHDQKWYTSRWKRDRAD